MTLREGGVRGFVPYPAPTDEERARWAAEEAAQMPAITATAIRARDNWYAGGYHRTAAEVRHPDFDLVEHLLLEHPQPKEVPDLMEAMKKDPKPAPVPPVLASVITDLDREIARLTEARERLEGIANLPAAA